MSSQEKGDREGGRPRILELSEGERELLLKACQRLRAAIPSYLKSKEEERAILDALLEKLS